MKVLLVLISCLGAVSPATNRIAPDASEFDAFDALDDYSLLDIIERLDSVDLVAAASVSPRITQLVWLHNLVEEFSEKSKIVRIQISTVNNLLELRNVSEDRRYKKFSDDFNHTLATLKVLCPVFGHLDLIIDLKYLAHEAVNKAIAYVNRYCSTIPKMLTIKNAGDPFGQFTVPNVTNVAIEYAMNLESARLAERFPHVEQLTIVVDKFSAIKEHLPHLKHFELMDSTGGHFDVKTFVEMNPQIRSVRLDMCEGLFNLQQVNENLPNLVSLHYNPKRDARLCALDANESAVQAVRFANISSYTIDLSDWTYSAEDAIYGSAFTRLSAIQFDQLATFKIVPSPYFDTKDQLDFVAQYKEVDSLDYARRYGLHCEDVWRLVDTMPNLTEITLRPVEYFGKHEEFLRLMTESNLKTIHAMVGGELADEFRAFALPGQWRLSSEKNAEFSVFYKCLTFECQ